MPQSTLSQDADTPQPASGQSGSEFLALAVEDAVVTRQRIAGDLVRVETSTQNREHLVDEELTHERVVVERVAIGRVVDAVPEVRVEGDVTIMPVVTEEIIVQRRLVLTEEVHLRRVRVTERHTETVSLREQVATVTVIAPGAATESDADVPDNRANKSSTEEEHHD